MWMKPIKMLRLFTKISRRGSFTNQTNAFKGVKIYSQTSFGHISQETLDMMNRMQKTGHRIHQGILDDTRRHFVESFLYFCYNQLDPSNTLLLFRDKSGNKILGFEESCTCDIKSLRSFMFEGQDVEILTPDKMKEVSIARQLKYYAQVNLLSAFLRIYFTAYVYKDFIIYFPVTH